MGKLKPFPKICIECHCFVSDNYGLATAMRKYAAIRNKCVRIQSAILFRRSFNLLLCYRLLVFVCPSKLWAQLNTHMHTNLHDKTCVDSKRSHFTILRCHIHTKCHSAQYGCERWALSSLWMHLHMHYPIYIEFLCMASFSIATVLKRHWRSLWQIEVHSLSQKFILLVMKLIHWLQLFGSFASYSYSYTQPKIDVFRIDFRPLTTFTMRFWIDF